MNNLEEYIAKKNEMSQVIGQPEIGLPTNQEDLDKLMDMLDYDSQPETISRDGEANLARVEYLYWFYNQILKEIKSLFPHLIVKTINT